MLATSLFAPPFVLFYDSRQISLKCLPLAKLASRLPHHFLAYSTIYLAARALNLAAQHRAPTPNRHPPRQLTAKYLTPFHCAFHRLSNVALTYWLGLNANRAKIDRLRLKPSEYC